MPAASAVHLTTEYDDTNVSEGGTYVTDAITVEAGKPVLIFVASAGGITAPHVVATGLGTTWVEELDDPGANVNRRLLLIVGTPPAGDTGSITLTVGTGATTGMGWSVVQAETDDPTVQIVSGEAAGPDTFSLTLAAGADADSRSLGFVFRGLNDVINPGANFTELGEHFLAAGAPAITVQSQISTSAFQTTVNWSHASSGGALWAGIAVELAKISAGGGAPVTVQVHRRRRIRIR